MKSRLAMLALLLAGCASPPPAFSVPFEEARATARRDGLPLLVLSVVGDLDGRL